MSALEAAAGGVPAGLATAVGSVAAFDGIAGARACLETRPKEGRGALASTREATGAAMTALVACVPMAAVALLELADPGLAFVAASLLAAAVANLLVMAAAPSDFVAAFAERRDLEFTWNKDTIRCVLEAVARVAIAQQAFATLGEDPVVSGLAAGAASVALVAAFQAYLCSVDGPPRADHPVNEDPAKVWREDKGVTVLQDRVYFNEKRVAAARKDITMAEVAKHNTRTDVWVCVEGHAYDLTKYVELHPGGWLPIANLAGRDVTDPFANYHPAPVYRSLLPNFYVGKIIDYKVSPFVKEHRDMRQDLLRRNQFETKRSFYVSMSIWYVSLLSAAVYFTVWGSSVAEHMAGAVFLALFWQQSAFFGHDIGHNAVTHVRKSDSWWGMVMGNITGGISLSWWKRSHNVHHVVCNSIENDPDIQHMPILAVDKEIFGSFFSTYHQRQIVTDAAARFLVAYQHILYFPVMAVARFNLYIQSYLLLFSGERIEYKATEVGTLAIFSGLLVAAMYNCMSSWQEGLAYLLLSHALAGVLHVQITLSHFAEQTYHGQAYNDETDEWFHMQVKTSLNVDCPLYMDWFHGGLQFQVEHHLYPRLPRHNLRDCRTLVRALCAKHGITYNELPFFEGIQRVIDKLHLTAKETRYLKLTDGGFYDSAIFHGANLLG